MSTRTHCPGHPADRLSAAAVLALLLLCAACQTSPPAPRKAAPELPAAPPLPVPGAVHYRIDAGESALRILVYRGGPLAEFGHNHVIAARELEGDVYLTPDIHDAGFRLRIPVQEFVVDPPAARKEEGQAFSSQPSEQAIAGTRKNMLGPDVLDAERYPDITVRSVSITGPEWAPEMTVRVTLHGMARDLTVPVALDRGDGSLSVTGTLELQQTDFGMTPFAVMGGGLRVQDRVRIRFRIVAAKR